MRAMCDTPRAAPLFLSLLLLLARPAPADYAWLQAGANGGTLA